MHTSALRHLAITHYVRQRYEDACVCAYGSVLGSLGSVSLARLSSLPITKVKEELVALTFDEYSVPAGCTALVSPGDMQCLADTRDLALFLKTVRSLLEVLIYSLTYLPPLLSPLIFLT